MKQQIVITSLALIFAGELVSSASVNRRGYEDDKNRELGGHGGRGGGGRGGSGGRGGRGQAGGRGGGHGPPPGRGGLGGSMPGGGPQQRLFTSFAEPLVMPSNGNANAGENGGAKMMVDVSKWLLPAMPMLFFN